MFYAFYPIDPFFPSRAFQTAGDGLQLPHKIFLSTFGLRVEHCTVVCPCFIVLCTHCTMEHRIILILSYLNSKFTYFLLFFSRSGNSLSARYFRERQNDHGPHHRHQNHHQEQPKSGHFPQSRMNPNFERGRQTQSSLDLNDPVWKVSFAFLSNSSSFSLLNLP